MNVLPHLPNTDKWYHGIWSHLTNKHAPDQGDLSGLPTVQFQLKPCMYPGNEALIYLLALKAVANNACISYYPHRNNIYLEIFFLMHQESMADLGVILIMNDSQKLAVGSYCMRVWSYWKFKLCKYAAWIW